MSDLKILRTKEIKADTSFILYHLGSLAEEKLIDTIESYYQFIRVPEQYVIEIVILLDGIEASKLGKVLELQKKEKRYLTIVEGVEVFTGPGKLWNEGFEVSTGEIVGFIRTGIKWKIDSFFYLQRMIKQDKNDVSYGPTKFQKQGRSGQSIDYMLLTRECFKRIGKFVEDKESTCLLEWEFLQRLNKDAKVEKLNGSTLIFEEALDELDYQYTFKQNKMQLMRKIQLEKSEGEEKEKFKLTEHEATHVANTTFMIYHHKSMSKDDLIYSIESYRKQKGIVNQHEIEIIVLLDGVTLEDLPIVREIMLKVYPQFLVIEAKEDEVGPGKMWNKGLQIASGEWVVFTWTGAIWYEDSLIHLRRLAAKHKTAAYGPVVYEMTGEGKSFTPKGVGIGTIALQTVGFANTIPLCYMVIHKDVIDKVGRFEEELEMAQIADWEFTKRLNNHVKIEYLAGKKLNVKNALNCTHFERQFKEEIDEKVRRVFFNNPGQGNVKVAIITGFNEGAQVQLCLLNYMELMPEHFSWRRFVENEIIPEELEGYDVVFLIRSRSLKALEVAQFCLAKAIKVVYMLDDNWFCATETYPQLESQIGKQTMAYFYFTLLISIVDEVWVYNELTKEDMKTYNPNIYVVPVNVNLSHFTKHTLKDESWIHLGFAGSGSKIQHFSHAFQALERIMKEFENVRLYFKGIALPNTFLAYENRIIQEEYSLDYKLYAKEVSSWHYDIMISPLEDTRYINSKCINKYLEITASGAVGIYTAIPLYDKVIKNGENGLIVANEEQAWYESIKKLILDEKLRKDMAERAYTEVEKYYDTKQVMGQFLKRIESLIGEGKR